MNDQDIFLAIGNALRAREPRAILFLAVGCILILGLLFGFSTLWNLIRILMPFWIPVATYFGSQYALTQYQKKHPEFQSVQPGAIAITAAVIVVLLIIARL